MADKKILLEARDLVKEFALEGGKKGKNVVHAVSGVNLKIYEGETLALVGESGCGKSVTSMSILKLLPPEGKVVEGEILFKGRDLTKCTSREMEKVRGKEIAMIFQEPMTSLNPVYTVGKQIEEMLRNHQQISKKKPGKRRFTCWSW